MPSITPSSGGGTTIENLESAEPYTAKIVDCTITTGKAWNSEDPKDQLQVDFEVEGNRVRQWFNLSLGQTRGTNPKVSKLRELLAAISGRDKMEEPKRFFYPGPDDPGAAYGCEYADGQQFFLLESELRVIGTLTHDAASGYDRYKIDVMAPLRRKPTAAPAVAPVTAPLTPAPTREHPDPEDVPF